MILEQPKLVVISTKPEYSLDPKYIKYADVAPDCSFENLTINIDAIGVSLYNLLTTKFGERLNLPDYGVNLDDILFELMDEDAERKILREIYEAVTAWEPRVRLSYGKSSVKGNPDAYTYEISLVFELVGLDNLLIKYSGTLSRFKNVMSNIVS